MSFALEEYWEKEKKTTQAEEINEIAKCPICGEMPRTRYGGILGKEPVSYSNCGAAFETLVHWNQYAAAMECLTRHNALVDAAMPVVKFWEGEKPAS